MVVQDDEAERDTLPRVAVIYDAMSLNPMVLNEAAGGICRLVWVVDCGDPVMAPLVRLLRRIGEVVDSADLGPDALGGRPRGARAQRHPHVLGGQDAVDGGTR